MAESRDGRADARPSEAVDPSEVCPDHVVLSSKGRGWNGVVIERYLSPPMELEAPAHTEHLVMLHLGPPIRLLQQLDGRPREVREVRGNVAVLPAGRESRLGWDATRDDLQVRFAPTFVDEVAEAIGMDADRVEILDCLGARDPHVQNVGLALEAELEAGSPNGRSYAESQAYALADYLLRFYSAFGRGAPRRYVRGLSGSELRRAVECINDDLARDLSLAEIADAAGISPYHFARLFKLSTGFAPHQYVLRTRLERARRLLLLGDLSVAEVARAVGFYDQSHLHRHFRRLFGATPGQALKNSKNLQ